MDDSNRELISSGIIKSVRKEKQCSGCPGKIKVGESCIVTTVKFEDEDKPLHLYFHLPENRPSEYDDIYDQNSSCDYGDGFTDHTYRQIRELNNE